MMDDTIFFRYLGALQPRRKSLGDILLPEALGTDAGRIAFHGEWTSAQMGEHDGRDRFVVVREIAFRDPVVGKQHLVRVRDHRSLAGSRFSRRHRRFGLFSAAARRLRLSVSRDWTPSRNSTGCPTPRRCTAGRLLSR